MTLKEGSKQLIPDLRFAEFRGGGEWKAVNGNDLFEPVDRRPATPGLPLLAITQDRGPVPRDHIDYHVSVSQSSIASYKEVRPGDFIISLRSFQGGIEYSRFHGICSPAYLVMRRKGEGHDDFFRHLFKSERFIQQLTRNIEGLRDGKMISYKQFSEQLLPVPNVVEQRRVADCLTSLDEWISTEALKLETLRIYRRGLMQQLFPCDGDAVPRLRLPEFRGEPNWTAHPLDHFVVRSFYGTSSSTSEKGKYPVLRMGNLVDGGLDISNLVYIDLDDAEFQSLRLMRGDILLNRTNSMDLVGKVSMFDLPGDYITASYIVTYRMDNQRLEPSFLNLMLNTPQYRRRIKALARPSVSQANINPTAFRNEVLIQVPSLAEQRRIAGCLSSIGALIAAQASKVEGLRLHKKGLSERLFPLTRSH